MKKLTIGSLVYDDFEGTYFSYQSLRLNNQDILEDLDLVVIDNHPESPDGAATKDFCHKANIRYVSETKNIGTAQRNKVFENAKAPHTLCMDPHVIFEPHTIKNLLAFYAANPNNKDLYQGPLLMDCIKGHDPMTHMDPVWRDHMWGTWAIDKRGIAPNLPPFAIPMQGLGVFSCKTQDWLGFNDKFIGFGGEEGYIHEKFRKAKRQCWCLPFFRWLHRFGRPRGVPYPLQVEHRIHNYLRGFTELGLDSKPVLKHFEAQLKNDRPQAIMEDLDGMRDRFLVEHGLKDAGPVPTLPTLLDSATVQNIVLELPE
jgi:hypothetical protein